MSGRARALPRLGRGAATLIPAVLWLSANPVFGQVKTPGPGPETVPAAETKSANAGGGSQPGQTPKGLAKIEVDRSARTFSVPGRVIKRDQPLEYLAVKRGGYKAYEAVIELDTTATEFNLACILIGLDADRSTPPKHHFDPRPIEGDRVELALEWGEGEAARSVAPDKLFRIQGKPPADDAWVYTGSTLLAPGRYLAEEVGTLVGFVHDQDSIIEHRSGIGIGNFGSAEIDKDLLPVEGTAIRLRVRNPAPVAPPG